MAFGLTFRKVKSYVIVTRLLAIVVLLVLSTTYVQSQSLAGAATLQGVIKDPQNHPVAAVAVSLQPKVKAAANTQILTALTDSQGKYTFSALAPGAYALRASLTGYGELYLNALTLVPNEVRTMDLALTPTTFAGSLTSSTALPEFFDEPQFTVAGITDSSASGGHGSNTVMPSTEALMKRTLALGEKPSGGSPPMSSLSTQEKSLVEIATREPDNFDANRQLGKLMVGDGKARDAIPFLERASRLNPSDYASAYELALAYANSGNYQISRKHVEALLSRNDNAELHHLLGDIEEALADSLDAVREYQRAAELNASEPNIFDWGTELLLHRALEPAIVVFTKGNRLFPQSTRMLEALGAALFADGAYEQSAQRLCAASDLDPNSPAPYLFLGEMQTSAVIQSEAVTERLRRFARFQPENAQANYYYAVSLWQQPRNSRNAGHSAQIEALLQKAVHLDSGLVDGYLHLGILYSERKDFPKAISAYQQAIKVSPQLAEAHYRLSQVYRQAEDVTRSQQELALYQHLKEDAAGKSQHEPHDIQRFVYTLRSPTAAPKPQ